MTKLDKAIEALIAISLTPEDKDMEHEQIPSSNEYAQLANRKGYDYALSILIDEYGPLIIATLQFTQAAHRGDELNRRLMELLK